MQIQTQSPILQRSIHSIERPAATQIGQLNGRQVRDVTGGERHGVAASILAWCRSVHREVLRPIFNRVSSFVGEVSATICRLFHPASTQQVAATARIGALSVEPKFSPEFAEKFSEICCRLVYVAKNETLENGLFRECLGAGRKNQIMAEMNDSATPLAHSYSTKEMADIVKSVIRASPRPKIADIQSVAEGRKGVTEAHLDALKSISDESAMKCAIYALNTLSLFSDRASSDIRDSTTLNKTSLAISCPIYSLEDIGSYDRREIALVNEACVTILRAWKLNFMEPVDPASEPLIETTHL
ncbi:hypothetical protein PI93_019545 [Pandoraea fibrosis]|uniref:Uncharacterized protein n=1 Tax=Pandoraea fibrosis TaxID=1891094 RepID=A0ABX6HUK2_9BURK|nr:hypothetical protein [Pandoraea fibrosis]QHE91836.1 hypothetical protein PJ20_008455 [Pandoraea fibrosis]QHF14606.1 hypothetical protein PI93_019545 [Pandoraea fibrosis]